MSKENDKTELLNPDDEIVRLIYELYVTVSHRSIYYFRGKVSKCL